MKKKLLLLLLSILFVGAEANAAIVPAIVASRTSGVAPLAVFFDAIGTTGLTDNGFFSDSAAYMDATFAWDFDADNNDPNGKYEKASGFVAAHVFDQPGTYRVHLDVYDVAGETASKDIAITVSNFSGTTYYVADDGSDSNNGLSMSSPFLTASHALTGSHMQPNVKILFKQGDTFNTACFTMTTSSVIIDSYNDPSDPSIDKPIIYSTESNGAYATFYINANDVRTMNLAVTSGGTTYSTSPRYPNGINFSNNTNNNLKYRTTEYTLGQVPMWPGGQYNTIAECVFHDVNQTGYSSPYLNPNDGNALIGNILYNKTGDAREHTFRLQGGSRYFIAHNTFGPNVIVNADALTIRGNTTKVVIYKNKLEGYVQAFTPQNQNSALEYQHHCIMDANLFIGPGVNEGDRTTAVLIDAKDIVFRNNIIYNYRYGIVIKNDKVVGASQRIKLYNNTFINPSVSSTFYIFGIDPECLNLDVKNNLMLDVAGTSSIRFIDILNGTTFGGESNNNIFYGSSWGANPTLFNGSTLASWRSSTGNDQNSSIQDPLLVSTDLQNANFCVPQENSPLVNSGRLTGGALDYYGNLRDSLHDIGAVEYVKPTLTPDHKQSNAGNPYPNPFNPANGQKLVFSNLNQNSTL